MGEIKLLCIIDTLAWWLVIFAQATKSLRLKTASLVRSKDDDLWHLGEELTNRSVINHGGSWRKPSLVEKYDCVTSHCTCHRRHHHPSKDKHKDISYTNTTSLMRHLFLQYVSCVSRLDNFMSVGAIEILIGSILEILVCGFCTNEVG